MPVDCGLCDMAVPNYECLAQHYLNVHRDSYMSSRAGKCNICFANNPQNIKKHKRYRTCEDLEVHLKSQHTCTELLPLIKARCMSCTEEFDYYRDLAKHYLSNHDDNYRSKYCGICDLCSMIAQMDDQIPGATPDTVYPTYTELKAHWQQAHLKDMAEDAKQLLEENKLGLTRGSM